MHPKKLPSGLSGARRLTISDEIFEFIRQVVVAGAKDLLGPKAKRTDIEREVRRRFSL